jgi:hypothetical protein
LIRRRVCSRIMDDARRTILCCFQIRCLFRILILELVVVFVLTRFGGVSDGRGGGDDSDGGNCFCCPLVSQLVFEGDITTVAVVMDVDDKNDDDDEGLVQAHVDAVAATLTAPLDGVVGVSSLDSISRINDWHPITSIAPRVLFLFVKDRMMTIYDPTL